LEASQGIPNPDLPPYNIYVAFVRLPRHASPPVNEMANENENENASVKIGYASVWKNGQTRTDTAHPRSIPHSAHVRTARHHSPVYVFPFSIMQNRSDERGGAFS